MQAARSSRMEEAEGGSVGEHGGDGNMRRRQGTWLWRGVGSAALAVVVVTNLVVATNTRNRSERTALGESNPLESLASHVSPSAAQYAAKMDALHRVALMHEQNTAKVAHALHRAALTHILDVVETDGSGTCPQPPKLHAYHVNALTWPLCPLCPGTPLEVLGVSVDANGKETSIPLGYVVKEDGWGLRPKETWKDPTGNVIATSGNEHLVSRVPGMYINDCNGTKLATLSLQVAPKQGSTWNQEGISQWILRKTDGDVLATVTVIPNFGVNIGINEQATGKRVASLSRSWWGRTWQFDDSWSVVFSEGQAPSLASDPRVVVMLLAVTQPPSWGVGWPLLIAVTTLGPILAVLLLPCCFKGGSIYAAFSIVSGFKEEEDEEARRCSLCHAMDLRTTSVLVQGPGVSLIVPGSTLRIDDELLLVTRASSGSITFRRAHEQSVLTAHAVGAQVYVIPPGGEREPLLDNSEKEFAEAKRYESLADRRLQSCYADGNGKQVTTEMLSAASERAAMTPQVWQGMTAEERRSYIQRQSLASVAQRM